MFLRLALRRAAAAPCAARFASRAALPAMQTFRLPASAPAHHAAPHHQALALSNALGHHRGFSAATAAADDAGLSEKEMRDRLHDFQDLFVEARLCIEDAVDAHDTTYFDEDAKEAQRAVDEALDSFQELLDACNEEQRGEVQRGNGLKVEQLKEELKLALMADH